MGKRSKQARKGRGTLPSPQPHDPNGVDVDSSAVSSALSTLILDEQAEDGSSKVETDKSDESTAQSTHYGFDAICDICKKFYLTIISITTSTDRRIQNHNAGLHLGSISHIGPKPDCVMCSKLFAVRWTTSETNDYHLFALSAARILHGRSLQRLEKSRWTVSGSDIHDSILLAVVADQCDLSIIPKGASQYDVRKFMVSTHFGTGGEEPDSNDPFGRWESQLEEDDERHSSWLSKSNQNNTTVSMKTALNKADALGFVNEATGMSKSCPVTIAELKHRQQLGQRRINLLNIQPIETGDSHTPGNLGYIPHCTSLRENLPTVSLRSNVFHGRAVDPNSINYSLIRGWLKRCKEDCDLDSATRERKRFQKMTFHLFDCRERTIFRVASKRNLRYVALSYVWGNASTSLAQPCETLPFVVTDSCPNVIEDAIVVVLELGYRYLWVDSLCISPDGAVRHEQIASMDIVYKNAEFTIVVAAGDNADYGIPGVGKRPRIQQPQFAIGDHRYVAMTVDHEIWLRKSKYYTRGWTYQEFFFSRRRLVFTNYQVFFECRDQCVSPFQQESLNSPPRHIFNYKSDLKFFEDGFDDDEYLQRLPALWEGSVYGPEGSISYRQISEIEKVFSLVCFEYHVSQYTKRQLTFQEDSLQAISSILDRFAQGSHSIYHLYGLPFIPKQDWTYQEGSRDHTFGIKYGLLWTHGAQKTPKARRQQFPSWSWTGWEGEVNWLVPTTDCDKYEESLPEYCEFEVLRPPGGNFPQTCPVEKWRPSTAGNDHPKELRFKGNLCSIHLQRGEDRGLYLNVSEAFKSRIHLTDLGDGRLSKLQLYGLRLGYDINLESWHVLVIAKKEVMKDSVGSQFYSRAGVMIIPKSWRGWTQEKIVEGILV